MNEKDYRTQRHEASCESSLLDSELKLANNVASFHTGNRAVHTTPTTEIHKYTSKLLLQPSQEDSRNIRSMEPC